MKSVLIPPPMVVQPQGHINAVTAHEWQHKLKQAMISPYISGLLLDLGHVDSLDSAGLMVLVETLQIGKNLGRTLRLRRVSRSIKMILELSQLDKVFEIID